MFVIIPRDNTSAPVPIESLVPPAADGSDAPLVWKDSGAVGITVVACALLALVLCSGVMLVWPHVRRALRSRSATPSVVTRTKAYGKVGSEVRCIVSSARICVSKTRAALHRRRTCW